MLIIVGGMLIMIRDRFTILHFVLGQMAALGLTMLISWRLLRHYSTLVLTWLSFKQLKVVAIKAMPYALIVFLMTIYTRIDGVMILRLLEDGDYEAGVYAAGYRILDALNMVAFLFAMLLLPMFSATQSLPAQLRLLIDEGFRYMWLFVIPVCVFGILFRKEIMTGLYTQAEPYWGMVFGLLITTFVLMGMMYVFSTFLAAMGRIKSMNIVFAITVFLNILLNLLFIPSYKAAGAAAATLITQFFAVCGILVLCIGIFPLKVSVRYVFQVLGFTGFCILSCLLIVYTRCPWFLSLLMYIPVVVLIGVIFKILRWSELSSAFRRL
jgi:O-antigen/teichoic acid export membrane protein